MNKKTNLEYVDFQNEFAKYFKVIEVLGNHFFKEGNKANVYLSLDTEDLDEIFSDVRGEVSGENFLVNICKEVLGDFNSKSFNLFENLVDIHKAWENSNSKDFPPQLPFISLFIIAATKMGEDAEKIDYRAFYSQLYKVMQLPSKISNIKLQNNFRHTFGSKTTEDEREELFNKFSIWIDENSQFGVNTFINNNPSEHRSWILDQCLMNTKDRNTLPRFFKDKGFEPGNQNYLEKQLFNTFKKYLFNEYKARRFSPALRNNVLNDDLEENLKIRISQTIKDIHENWDGTILDPKGNKSIEILYVIEKNEREGNLEFKLFFDDIDKYFDVEKITFEDKFNKELIFEEDLFLASKYFCDEHNNFQFNQNIWKAKGIDLKARFVSYEKTVRLFKYEEFEVEEYIEVGKYESIKNSEEYIAVFPKSVAEDLTNWLENNPNIQFNKENVSSYGEICLIEEIKLINSIPYKVEKPFMEVFVPKSVLTDKIELIGGLTTGAKTYLSRELPTIFIPESYREDEDLQLTINGKSFELKEYIEPHEYVKDSTTKQYSIELNKDDIKIDFFVEFDTTQLISHLAGSIGYDFYFSLDEIKWNDINPNELDYEDLESGYLTGGDLFIPSTFMNSLELINFTKRCKEILIIGNKANQYNQIHIQEQRYSWIKEFSEYFKSYRLTESQKEETSNNMTLTHYPNFNLDFQYFIKESRVEDITWVFCIYENVIKAYQYGSKKPKIGFEDSNIEWANSILKIQKEIESEKIIEFINSDEKEGEFNKELFNSYVSKSKELLKNLKENPNVQIEHEEIQREIEIGVDEKKSNEIKFINEFKELPGERLLRYMSNVGSGTISSLRDAIVYIANSEPLKDLGLKEELEKNKKRFTDRVIENFSYLLHIEISSKNKWCIAKPSINILPGLQNRAIIVGSRNDYLLDRLFKNIQASDTYSVSCIDNSKLFQHIKLLKSASGSSESINISLDDNSKYHTYEVFSPTTIMVSDFENIMDLKDLCRDLEVKSVNSNTSYSYTNLLPSIDEMVKLSPKKKLKRYEMPQMFDELVVTSNKNTGTGWINAFYKGFVGNSLENNKMYRVKDFGSNKYYVVDQNNTHSVEKDIAFYSQLSQENKSFIFYKLQEPCGVLIIPSYLKLPKLYHKALGFCIGTNPKTLYRPLKDRNKTLPKLDLYFNIPEDLVRVLFEEKLGMKIIFINELEELDEMLGK